MSPLYLNPPPSSPITFLELKGDQHAFHVLGQIHDLDTSNSTLSYPNLDKKSHIYDESPSVEYSRHTQEKVEKVLSHEKPTNDPGHVFPSSSSRPQRIGDGDGCSYGYNSSNHSREGDKIEIMKNDENKWKPSKIRIMQKMMANSKNNGDQKVDHDNLEQNRRNNICRNNNYNNDNNNGIRVCSDCHTTTTPLWRSGPLGPKSLCNACGIRQRKARRAAMVAAATSEFAKEGTTMSIKAQNPKVEEIRGRGSDHTSHPLPLKKRGKTNHATKSYNNNNLSQNRKRLSFEDFTLDSSSNKDYIRANSQRVFPRDEEEGAILLMALSCGLAWSS